MIPSIPNFSRAHVLVIGDVMLDRYWHGNSSRISPEAPVPVVHITEQREHPGGAGNVALNITGLGGKATLVGVIGDDDAGEQIFTQLTSHGVHCVLSQFPIMPTTTKLRILSRHQQLIRLDFEEKNSPLDTQSLLKNIKAQLNLADVVVLSDYGKGVLANPQPIIQMARQAGKPVLVDPKGQDFKKYYGASLITPNLTEFEAVVGHCQTQEKLVAKGETLRQQLALEALLITRSEQGVTLLRQAHEPLHLPAHAREVFDVTGAGDTVIGVLAASLAVNHDLAASTALANLAAGIVVGKLGAASVKVAELELALHRQPHKGVYTIQNLRKIVQIAKDNGETIVMTNGCFDILHAGHVQYLTQARQLGDRLIVAVNDDNSVKRLKGPQRPINKLVHRMAVLNALECVDWAVPFTEDTPQSLICQLLPNILVKGEDYLPHEIAGSECVLENGGQVLTLDFVDGVSTTQLIQSMKTVSES